MDHHVLEAVYAFPLRGIAYTLTKATSTRLFTRGFDAANWKFFSDAVLPMPECLVVSVRQITSISTLTCEVVNYNGIQNRNNDKRASSAINSRIVDLVIYKTFTNRKTTSSQSAGSPLAIPSSKCNSQSIYIVKTIMTQTLVLTYEIISRNIFYVVINPRCCWEKENKWGF